jgi:hypothetical protein
VSVIRFTVVDQHGTTSFVGPAHAIKMLVAACSRNPTTTNELLEYTQPYDDQFVNEVRSGLAVFDEHNTPENLAAFQNWNATIPNEQLPPFRILDEETRRESLEPVETGLVLLNLKKQRIIQVQNSYEEVQRQNRGRIRRGGEPVPVLYRYKLPQTWQILP